MNSHTLTFSFWVCLFPWAVALVLIAFGIRSFVRRGFLRWWLVVGGALVAFFLGPTLFMDRIVVDDQGITHTTGFWFAPTVKGFDFAEIDGVRIRTERVRTRPGGAANQDFWYFINKTGESRRLVPGDLWSANDDEILRHLRVRGVEVSR
jgi:hypothetical protein